MNLTGEVASSPVSVNSGLHEQDACIAQRDLQRSKSWTNIISFMYHDVPCVHTARIIRVQARWVMLPEVNPDAES